MSQPGFSTKGQLKSQALPTALPHRQNFPIAVQAYGSLATQVVMSRAGRQSELDLFRLDFLKTSKLAQVPCVHEIAAADLGA